MVGNLKVVEQVLAVGKAVSVKEIVGMVSNPRVGGTSAAVAKARTSPRVAWASPPENKIERKNPSKRFIACKGMNHLMSVIERRELRGYGRCADTYSQE